MISNSAIYGLIRRNAREGIEKGIAADKKLASLTAAIRAAWVAPRPPPSQRPRPCCPSRTLVLQRSRAGRANTYGRLPPGPRKLPKLPDDRTAME